MNIQLHGGMHKISWASLIFYLTLKNLDFGQSHVPPSHWCDGGTFHFEVSKYRVGVLLSFLFNHIYHNSFIEFSTDSDVGTNVKYVEKIFIANGL